jgi:hypothetical protein
LTPTRKTLLAENERLRGALQLLGCEVLAGGGMRLTQSIYIRWYEAERQRIEKGYRERIEELENEIRRRDGNKQF